MAVEEKRDGLPNYIIEPMTEADLQDVVAIEEVSFKGAWSKGMFINELQNEVSNLFVAKSHGRRADDGGVIAYTDFWAYLNEGHILNIAVAENFRTMGLGSIMLAFTLDKMKIRGVRNVYLEVRRSNTTAIKMYEKFGFEELHIRKNYYKDEDAIVMTLDLILYH